MNADLQYTGTNEQLPPTQRLTTDVDFILLTQYLRDESDGEDFFSENGSRELCEVS